VEDTGCSHPHWPKRRRRAEMKKMGDNRSGTSAASQGVKEIEFRSMADADSHRLCGVGNLDANQL
jgi:hypothetical protein